VRSKSSQGQKKLVGTGEGRGGRYQMVGGRTRGGHVVGENAGAGCCDMGRSEKKVGRETGRLTGKIEGVARTTNRKVLNMDPAKSSTDA